MKIDLNGRRALITGGGRGIGAAIAHALAAAGADLLLLDVDAVSMKETTDQLNLEYGIRVGAIVVDLLNAEKTVEAVKVDTAENGDCDILIHNAGITKDNLLMRMSPEQWDLVLKVNLYPLHYLTQALLRPMMKARWGRIVAISSVSGLMGNPGQCNYASSKAGIVGFVKSLAREVGSRNITVNAIAPGFIQTPMTEKLEDSQADKLKSAIALQRLGQPEDIANAIAFLSSDLASYITGTVINVSGGLYM